MLLDFLYAAARRPFVWGEEDCCLIAANWWREVHGVDPAARVRGSYSSKAECDAMLDREGGVARLFRRLAAGVSATRTGDPTPGDFGVVRHRGQHVGAIFAPDRKWAGKSASGLIVFTPEHLVAVWKI